MSFIRLSFFLLFICTAIHCYVNKCWGYRDFRTHPGRGVTRWCKPCTPNCISWYMNVSLIYVATDPIPRKTNWSIEKLWNGCDDYISYPNLCVKHQLENKCGIIMQDGGTFKICCCDSNYCNTFNPPPTVHHGGRVAECYQKKTPYNPDLWSEQDHVNVISCDKTGPADSCYSEHCSGGTWQGGCAHDYKWCDNIPDNTCLQIIDVCQITNSCAGLSQRKLNCWVCCCKWDKCNGMEFHKYNQVPTGQPTLNRTLCNGQPIEPKISYPLPPPEPMLKPQTQKEPESQEPPEPQKPSKPEPGKPPKPDTAKAPKSDSERPKSEVEEEERKSKDDNKVDVVVGNGLVIAATLACLILANLW